MSKYGVFSGRYFPIFRLHTVIYFLNLRFHSQFGKLRTRKNSIFEHFSHRANAHGLLILQTHLIINLSRIKNIIDFYLLFLIWQITTYYSYPDGIYSFKVNIRKTGPNVQSLFKVNNKDNRTTSGLILRDLTASSKCCCLFKI